jgi:hypothetical protein
MPPEPLQYLHVVLESLGNTIGIKSRILVNEEVRENLQAV